MILNPVPFLASKPIQKEAESEMDSCNRAENRDCDDKRGDPAESPMISPTPPRNSPTITKNAKVLGRCRSSVKARMLLARPGPILSQQLLGSMGGEDHA